MKNIPVVIKNGVKYYESEVSQENQKYTGWHWCSDTKAYYRWDGLMASHLVESSIPFLSWPKTS